METVRTKAAALAPSGKVRDAIHDAGCTMLATALRHVARNAAPQTLWHATFCKSKGRSRRAAFFIA